MIKSLLKGVKQGPEHQRKRKHGVSLGRDEKPAPQHKTGQSVCNQRMIDKRRLQNQGKKLLNNPEHGKFPILLPMMPDDKHILWSVKENGSVVIDKMLTQEESEVLRLHAQSLLMYGQTQDGSEVKMYENSLTKRGKHVAAKISDNTQQVEIVMNASRCFKPFQ